MASDPMVREAYAEVRTARGWWKERQTPRWKLAQAAATDRNLLNGPRFMAVATNPQAAGKGGRKLVKRNKA